LPRQRFYNQHVVGSCANRRAGSARAASFEHVNRKQRRRRLARHRAHAAQKDEPRHTMSRASYTPVKQGHIVPVVYQRNFAIGDRITLHVDNKPGVPAAIQNTATRGPFYRRTRPDGSEIDDVEASLSYIEAAVSPVFDDLLAAAPMTRERKQVLAQIFGIQLVRGPAFVERRSDVIDGLVSGLDATHFTRSLLREVAGDLAVARERVRDAYLSKTQQVITMLTTSFKLASVIGSMRWHLLQFVDPIVAYSDHPVVVWPMAEATATPFPKPELAPMAAIEVRAPISPHLALLMTWVDEPDDHQPVAATPQHAAELNAFTISQAERQWMHQPGTVPPVATGTLTPLSREFETSYTVATVEASLRRQAAGCYLHRVRKKRFVSDIEIVDVAR
jgi:hypothetical protein